MTLRNARLGRAILFVKDLERMAAFYRDALGLRVVPEAREEGWVELDAGGTSLALHAIRADIAASIEISTPPLARQNTPLKLVFETTDVEAARERLSRLGAVMDELRLWGGCDGVDPEGNVFQIVPKYSSER